MTDRTMGDSVTVANVPQTVDIAAFYRNGKYVADPQVVASRFPAARYVTLWIDVNGSDPQSSQILDVETGDAEAWQAPGWIKARRAVVHTSLPTIYCNRSKLPEVLSAGSARGLHAGEHYHLWIATLDGSEEMNGQRLRTVPGVVAVQVEGGQDAAFDRSVVYNPHWHPLAH